jgi:3-hydroxyisobutyrate dehydrogenase-like beta-hydroxyacid dehydrogenase
MKIGMIGSGNVAWHLSHRLFEAGNPPLFVWSRNHESAYRLASQVLSVTLPDLSSIHRDIDLLIMAVHDDAIGEIAPEVTLPSNVIAAHTSGTASMQVILSISGSSTPCRH